MTMPSVARSICPRSRQSRAWRANFPSVVRTADSKSTDLASTPRQWSRSFRLLSIKRFVASLAGQIGRSPIDVCRLPDTHRSSLSGAHSQLPVAGIGIVQFAMPDSTHTHTHTRERVTLCIYFSARRVINCIMETFQFRHPNRHVCGADFDHSIAKPPETNFSVCFGDFMGNLEKGQEVGRGWRRINY